MSFISELFGHLMKWIYMNFMSLGPEPARVSYLAMALMVMALVSKIITIPLTWKSTQVSEKMQKFQPELDKIKEKYSYDERILQQKIQEYYKEHNMTMAGCSGCLPMIIQFVLIIALFYVIQKPGKYMFEDPSAIDRIQKNFLWIPDLTKADPKAWFGMPLLNMFTQLGVTFLNPQMKQQEQAGMSTSFMKYMPIMFYVITIKWSAGLLLYWAVGNLFEIIFRGISTLIVKLKKKEGVPEKD